MIKIDLFSFRGLLPHFRPCDDSLENSWFQSFKLSRIFKRVIFRRSKEHFSREYHVIWNGNENCPSLTGLLKVGKFACWTEMEYYPAWFSTKICFYWKCNFVVGCGSMFFRSLLNTFCRCCFFPNFKKHCTFDYSFAAAALKIVELDLTRTKI